MISYVIDAGSQSNKRRAMNPNVPLFIVCLALVVGTWLAAKIGKAKG